MVWIGTQSAHESSTTDIAASQPLAATPPLGTAVQKSGEARLRVTADISAQLPLKLLGFVARLDLVPRHVSIASTADMLHLVILTGSITEGVATIIANNMSSIVGVHSVEALWRPS